MDISIFSFIDEMIDYINSKEDFILETDQILFEFFKELLKEDDHLLNITHRVKNTDSIREKFLRNNYTNQIKRSEEIFEVLPDLIGIRLECRFNDDEEHLYEVLRKIFTERDEETGYYYSEVDPRILLEMSSEQPQSQKNGFSIYKLDGVFKEEKKSVRFELQIKSMVNLFWGEIDHRILYKNSSYMITEDFIREIMYSIRNNLTTIDKQLSIVYKNLEDHQANEWESTKIQLKNIVSKVIHDTYSKKTLEKTNIIFDLRSMSNLITDYIFTQLDIQKEKEFEKSVIELMNRVNSMVEKETKIGERLNIDPNYKVERAHHFGEHLRKVINMDFNWNLCFHILFDISLLRASDEFVNFVEYIVYTVNQAIRNGVRKFEFSKEKEDILVEELSKYAFQFFTIKYDLDNFLLENINKLTYRTEEYLGTEDLSLATSDLELSDFLNFLLVGHGDED